MSGYFITLEGPDGSGKTSHVKPLADYLRDRGIDLLTTREPGGTPIGDQIREVIMSMANKGMHPRTEILLFQSSRAQLVEQVIRPALDEGKVVLCDRYADSTLAYQGYGHGIDLGFLGDLLSFTTGALKPDLSILLDIDVQSGLERRHKSGGEWNRLDDYDLAFHERVRAGYHELVKLEPHRWVTVDASQSKEKIQQELRQIILSRLPIEERKA